MLGHGYLQIGVLQGGVEVFKALPNPINLEEAYDNVETVGTSEGGHDLVNITRLQKRNWTLTLQLTSWMLDTVKAWCLQSTCHIKLRGDTVKVRPRITGASLYEWSQFTQGTDGLYTVNMTLTEI